MKIGLVIGRTTLSAADAALSGSRWLLVSPLAKDQFGKPPPYTPSDQYSLVCYDRLGAATGDLIGYVEGGEATATFEQPTPVDAYCVCLIDRINYSPPKQALSA